MCYHPREHSAHSHKLFINPQLEASKKTPAWHSGLRAGTQKRLLNVLSTERVLFFFFFNPSLITPPLTSYHCQDPLLVLATCRKSRFRILPTMPICHEWVIYISLKESSSKLLVEAVLTEVVKAWLNRVHGYLRSISIWHNHLNNDSELPRHQLRLPSQNQSYQSYAQCRSLTKICCW